MCTLLCLLLLYCEHCSLKLTTSILKTIRVNTYAINNFITFSIEIDFLMQIHGVEISERNRGTLSEEITNIFDSNCQSLALIRRHSGIDKLFLLFLCKDIEIC